MNEPQVIQILILLDDGSEALVEPVHGPECRKGLHGRRWTGMCQGCRFDILAKELWDLHRPVVVDVNHREDVSDENI